MKTIFWVVIFTVLSGMSSTYACAICGCGNGNYYFGIMPQFQKNFVGIRYLNYSYTSHIGEGYKPFEATQETFQTTELWMRFYPVNRVQIFSMIDYNFNTQVDQGITKNLQGFGDIPVLISYNIINTTTRPDGDKRMWNHNLFMGGGVKLPTGKYKFSEDQTQVANANFQLGTGSVDFMVNALYTLRYKRFGVSVDANYKINTANSNDYTFGNRVSGSASLFYIQQLKKFGLMPNAGIYAESSRKNKQYGISIDDTGGQAYFISAGLETYYKKFAIGFTYQSTLVQHLAGDHSKAHEKAMAHITFLF